MTFSTRLLLCSVIPALLFCTAQVTGLWSLTRTLDAFNAYIDTEQAVESSLTELYAQGLQGGQALRNIVLDPANPQAYRNLDASRVAYDQAYKVAQAKAEATAMAPEVTSLAALRATQITLQDEVATLAKTDRQAAMQALNSRETPAWRELRSALLAQIDVARALSVATHEQTHGQAVDMRALALGLALLALAVSAALTVVMARTLGRELGGDPAQARAALGRVAEGDLSIDAAAPDAQRGLMVELRRMQTGLCQLVSQVHGSTVSITHV